MAGRAGTGGPPPPARVAFPDGPRGQEARVRPRGGPGRGLGPCRQGLGLGLGRPPPPVLRGHGPGHAYADADASSGATPIPRRPAGRPRRLFQGRPGSPPGTGTGTGPQLSTVGPGRRFPRIRRIPPPWTSRSRRDRCPLGRRRSAGAGRVRPLGAPGVERRVGRPVARTFRPPHGMRCEYALNAVVMDPRTSTVILREKTINDATDLSSTPGST